MEKRKCHLHYVLMFFKRYLQFIVVVAVGVFLYMTEARKRKATSSMVSFRF